MKKPSTSPEMCEIEAGEKNKVQEKYFLHLVLFLLAGSEGSELFSPLREEQNQAQGFVALLVLLAGHCFTLKVGGKADVRERTA